MGRQAAFYPDIWSEECADGERFSVSETTVKGWAAAFFIVIPYHYSSADRSERDVSVSLQSRFDGQEDYLPGDSDFLIDIDEAETQLRPSEVVKQDHPFSNSSYQIRYSVKNDEIDGFKLKLPDAFGACSGRIIKFDRDRRMISDWPSV